MYMTHRTVRLIAGILMLAMSFQIVAAASMSCLHQNTNASVAAESVSLPCHFQQTSASEDVSKYPDCQKCEVSQVLSSSALIVHVIPGLLEFKPEHMALETDDYYHFISDLFNRPPKYLALA